MSDPFIQKLIALAVVFVVGVIMAATGFSRDSFMGLILIAVGVYLLWSCAKYWKNPVYTDASGNTKPVGKPMLAFMIVLGVLLFASGCYVGFVGIPQ
jgi:small-conductance mechanosensitive channel